MKLRTIILITIATLTMASCDSDSDKIYSIAEFIDYHCDQAVECQPDMMHQECVDFKSWYLERTDDNIECSMTIDPEYIDACIMALDALPCPVIRWKPEIDSVCWRALCGGDK